LWAKSVNGDVLEQVKHALYGFEVQLAENSRRSGVSRYHTSIESSLTAIALTMVAHIVSSHCPSTSFKSDAGDFLPSRHGPAKSTPVKRLLYLTQTIIYRRRGDSFYGFETSIMLFHGSFPAERRVRPRPDSPGPRNRAILFPCHLHFS